MMTSGTFSFRRPRAQVLEIREGGGCLALFGAPFLAAGLFVFAVGLGFVPMSNGDELPAWGWVVFLLMGVAFTGVGGALLFGRRTFVLDLERHAVEKRAGLLVARWERDEHPLARFDAVRLQFEAGDSDSADSYPVFLRPRDGGAALQLLSSTAYETSRAAAVEVATFLRWPLVDATTNTETISDAASIDAPLRMRVMRARDEGAAPIARPSALRTEVRDAGHEVRIVIPPTGLRRVAVGLSFVPVVFAVGLMMYLKAFFDATKTPGPVQWAFLGFVGLLFGAVPFAMALRGLVASVRARTTIVASAAGIIIERRHAWRTEATRLAAEEILEIDHDAVDARIEAARRDSELRLAQSGREVSPEMRDRALRWVTTFARRATSKGIVIKTRRELVRVGEGLPDDETRYLAHLVRQSVAGRPRVGVNA